MNVQDSWRRLRAGLRPSRGQALVAVLLFLVGFGGVVQVRQNRVDGSYDTARRDDLIQILDGLGQSSQRLEAEIRALESRRRQLATSANRAQVARQQADEQLRTLSILAGTAPAQGPGVRITLTDPPAGNKRIALATLLDAIQELRDAGAEAIQINGRARVVASTAFIERAGGIEVAGIVLGSPYVIEAIGNANNLAEAARFPGGVVDQVTGPQIGGGATVTPLSLLRITALHVPQPRRYAQPTSQPTR